VKHLSSSTQLWVLVWGLCWGLLLPQTLLATVTHSVGIARDAKNQTLRYVEHHQYLPSGDHLVKYFDASGKLLATKAMTYPGLPQHPEIAQTDFTRDTTVQTSNSDQNIEMVRTTAGKTERFAFPIEPEIIVDAGFDSFIRANWKNFREGEAQVYRLAVAGQENLLKVQITKQAASGDSFPFTIKPNNFFIRLLVPQMRVVYDSERRLSAYEGLTNLNIAEGKDRKIAIKFNHYLSKAALDRPRAQWLPEQ